MRSLGFAQKIYYKEHWELLILHTRRPLSKFITDPSRVGMNRSANYCDAIVNLNCDLIPLTVDLKSIKNMVPITLTGSIARKISLGLTTIYSEDPWWKGLPGTIHLSKLGNDFKEVPDKWVNPDDLIKASSEGFLKQLLNDTTLDNQLGMGITNKLPETETFNFELKKFLKLLHLQNNF